MVGRFTILGQLGSGTSGAVYRAHDPVLDREVALKVLPAAAVESDQAQTRFLRESKAAAQLRHPHIVPVYDAGNSDGHYYIASAFIEGETLANRSARQRLDFTQAARIVHDLAGALDYAHRQGVIHRDVKPANIMLDAQGQALLLDFGLARLQSETEQLTQEGTVLGTPAYMAPEQASPSLGEVGPASDQYSLGVVLYELLCGQTPFNGPSAAVLFNTVNASPPSPRKHNSQVPKDLETICLKALAKRCDERYASCAALAEDLWRWQADEPIHARRQGAWERAGKWARRNPALASLGLAVLFLATLSSAASVGLSAMRRDLQRSLQSEQEQVALIEAQRKRADQQTLLAQQQERVALEHEQIARAALAKLQGEAAARGRAEREKEAELATQKALSVQLKAQEARMASVSTAREEAHRKTAQAEQQRQALIESNPWTKYTELLLAADKAIQGKKLDEAKKSLEACPEEYRSWEWQLLLGLASGNAAKEQVIQYDATTHIAASADGTRLAVVSAPQSKTELADGIYSLPDLKLVAKMPFHYSRVAGILLWPDGRTLMAMVQQHQTYAAYLAEFYDVSSGRRKVMRASQLFGQLRYRQRYQLNRDGTSLLSGGVLYNTDSATAVWQFRCPDISFRPVANLMAFTPGGEVAAVGLSLEKPLLQLWLWSAATGASPRAVDIPVPATDLLAACGCLDFSADGELVLIFGNDMCHVLDSKSPRYVARIPQLVAVSPDHRRALCLKERRLLLREIPTGRELPALAALGWGRYRVLDSAVVATAPSAWPVKPASVLSLTIAADWTHFLIPLSEKSVVCWSHGVRAPKAPDVPARAK